MAKKLKACPGWLELSEDRTSFVFLPDRAKIVSHIFELSIAGLGGYTIAKQLDAKGIPAFGPSGRWDQSTIHNLLRNRATIGEHQPKQYRNRKEFPIGDPIANYYPAVIEQSLFEAAQKARQRNLATGRGRKGRLITNLFAGIPTCFYCGSPMKFHSNGNAKSLICAMVLSGLGCHRMAWSYRDFENSVFDFVMKCQMHSAASEAEREALSELVTHIRALSGPDVYDARLSIAIALRRTVTELAIACAGPTPAPLKPNARIRRDGPGRFFKIRIMGGEPTVVAAG